MELNSTIIREGKKEVIIITEDAEFNDFKNFASQIKDGLGIAFNEKIDDFDTLFWVFSFNDHDFVLYYNIYYGIKIYLKDEIQGNESLIQSLFNLLKSKRIIR